MITRFVASICVVLLVIVCAATAAPATQPSVAEVEGLRGQIGKLTSENAALKNRVAQLEYALSELKLTLKHSAPAAPTSTVLVPNAAVPRPGTYADYAQRSQKVIDAILATREAYREVKKGGRRYDGAIKAGNVAWDAKLQWEKNLTEKEEDYGSADAIKKAAKLFLGISTDLELAQGDEKSAKEFETLGDLASASSDQNQAIEWLTKAEEDSENGERCLKDARRALRTHEGTEPDTIEALRQTG